ncbi:hypothetical protein [Pseudoalteromonas byunsanensis]|uniref:Uncharacterized protein n=1 Tax=Pseudoalteromonas byunsanensis TaxID=327939 RepID=A0A1S1NC12_9GAMM|nr:hypothetical protein [Pseudoalteromonas byunsanensis]OHU97150.1 hypothetical protein BIW53_02185 [Pseudoalteromonas byunsanensis]
MKNQQTPIDDWRIWLSYIMILLLGYILGISFSNYGQLISYLSSFVTTTFPIIALLIAIEGLNSWKKAERIKARREMALCVIEYCSKQFEEISGDMRELEFLIEKKSYLENENQIESCQKMSESITKQIRTLESKLSNIANTYRENRYKLFIVDKELLGYIDTFINDTNVINKIAYEVNYKNDPEKGTSERTKRVKRLYCENEKIYNMLLSFFAVYD